MFSFHFVLQIIVTSKFWRPVHSEIHKKEPERFLIFGAPFVIAIAAITKFDVLFANRKRMSGPTSQQYKFQLILG